MLSGKLPFIFMTVLIVPNFTLCNSEVIEVAVPIEDTSPFIVTHLLSISVSWSESQEEEALKSGHSCLMTRSVVRSQVSTVSLTPPPPTLLYGSS